MEEIRTIDFVLAYLVDYFYCYKIKELANPIIYFEDINKFIDTFKKKYGNYDVDLSKKDWDTAAYYYKGKFSFSADYYSVQLWFTADDMIQLKHNIIYCEKHNKIIEVWKSIKES